MPAKWLDKVEDIDGLTVTPDAPVHVSGYSSNQLWPYESGVSRGWSGPDAPLPGTAPTIAVVDSGIQANRPDFGNRVLANVNFSTLPENSAGDGRGHGTFVAGIAAGGADGYTGATPQANLVSLDVMDDHGVARTSDVIAACQWILANKAKYNIRIANFSLHSATKSNFFRDPLDRAVEKLWFGGVVVVAAAGNYGSAAGPSGVPYAPGQRPLRDHRRRGGHRRNEESQRRLAGAVVGLRPDARRLHEARSGGARPLHGRPRSDGLLALDRARGQDRHARLHPALGHLVRGPGRRRSGRADPGQAPGVHS